MGVRRHPGDRAYHRAGGCLDALARSGQLPAILVSEMTVNDVRRMLDPTRITITETATRVRSRVESVLDWATGKGHITGKPW